MCMFIYIYTYIHTYIYIYVWGKIWGKEEVTKWCTPLETGSNSLQMKMVKMPPVPSLRPSFPMAWRAIVTAWLSSVKSQEPQDPQYILPLFAAQ